MIFDFAALSQCRRDGIESGFDSGSGSDSRHLRLVGHSMDKLILNIRHLTDPFLHRINRRLNCAGRVC
jgi:hypothetical protein